MSEENELPHDNNQAEPSKTTCNILSIGRALLSKNELPKNVS